jgi:hypothetical protein
VTPFHVQCQTCRAYLRVTKPEAIGLILGCPKCNGMVEVQPPPEWQDTTGEVPLNNATTEATSAAASPTLGETAPTSSRWVVPSIAAGALLCTGFLSWVGWTQLREPDRVEPQPIVAATTPESTQVKTPPLDEAAIAPPAEPLKIVKEQNPTVPQQESKDPPALAENPAPQLADPTPPAAAALPKANEQAPLELAPPKPKLVLKPEQSPPAQPEAPLFARGPEANPTGATQAAPAADVEEKPVFNKPPEVSPPIVAPVVPPQVAAAPLPRTPLTAVNPKHLELTLASVTYDQVPLHAFLREMGELAHAEIGIDDETLQRSGWRLNTPIRVQLQNVTVRGALQSALRPLDLDLLVKENYLWIGHAAAAETTHLTRYPIDDLVNKASADTDTAELAAQVQRLVAPDRWAAGKLDIVPGALLVTQSAPVHDELIVWFEKLRTARGLPLRTKYDPANAQLRRFAPQRFAMTTRWRLAEPLLGKPVTASFLQPETLGEILDVFCRQTQMVLSWDLPALDAAGLSPDTLTTFTVQDARLEQALAQLLEPSGLTVVPLDETSLLVTTKTVAARRQLTERYSVGRLLELRRWGDDEAAVTAGFRQELNARGIELPETVPLAWDRASRTLAISTSPPAHRGIEKILGELQQKPVAATAVIKK